MGKLNESNTRTPFIRLQGSDGKHGHCYRGTRQGLTESLQLEGKHCAMFSKPSNVISPPTHPPHRKRSGEKSAKQSWLQGHSLENV